MADEPITDPVFGELTRERPWGDDSEGWWRAEVRLTPKHPLRVILRGVQQARAVWHALYERVRSNELEIRLAVADLLLAGDDERAWPRAARQGLTRAEAAWLVTLEEVVLDDNGAATLWYQNPRISSRYSAAAQVDAEGV